MVSSHFHFEFFACYIWSLGNTGVRWWVTCHSGSSKITCSLPGSEVNWEGEKGSLTLLTASSIAFASLLCLLRFYSTLDFDVTQSFGGYIAVRFNPLYLTNALEWRFVDGMACLTNKLSLSLWASLSLSIFFINFVWVLYFGGNLGVECRSLWKSYFSSSDGWILETNYLIQSDSYLKVK